MGSDCPHAYMLWTLVKYKLAFHSVSDCAWCEIILALEHAAAAVGHKANDLLVSMLCPEQNNALDCGMFLGDVIHRCIQ